MLELSWRGSKTVALGDSGLTRKFIADGDEVNIVGFLRRLVGWRADEWDVFQLG